VRSRRLFPGRLGSAASHRKSWEKTAAVAVKIKLKRLGKIREPYYRIVVADARTKRDGRAIEEVGKYHPKAEPSLIEVNSERVQHWLSVGAQPTDPVMVLLKITGDWQKFRGEPGAEGTLRTAAPREDKKEVFAAAAKESQATKEAKESAKDSKSGSRGSKARDTKAADTKAEAKDTKAQDSKAETAKAETAKADSPKAKDTKTADAKAEDTKAEETKADSAKAEETKAEAKAEDTKAEAKAEDTKAAAEQTKAEATDEATSGA
jgi:small subunit ribosomal protein S16